MTTRGYDRLYWSMGIAITIVGLGLILFAELL